MANSISNRSNLNHGNIVRINGEAAGDGLGFSVSGVGDINNDGIDDLIISAPYADTNGSNSGSSYVVFGRQTGFSTDLDLSSLDGSNGFKIHGEAVGDQLGFSVSGAGDVNGDGIDDLIIGAPYTDTNGFDSGSSYVVFGRQTGFSSDLDLLSLNGSNGFKIHGEAVGDKLGFSVSGAGDVNGDGIDDLIISAPDAGTIELFPNGPTYGNNGISYIVFGSHAGFSANLELSSLNGNNGFKIDGEGRQDRLGISVSGAGDVNGDGMDDLIIASDSGSNYVIFGSDTGFSTSLTLSSLNGSNGFKISGETESSSQGRSVRSAGDINGDGIDDLIIGADLADPNSFNSGASYVIFGRNTGFNANLELSTLDGSNGFKINGEREFDRFGISVSSAGDINGDGIDDLIIGAKGVDSTAYPRSYSSGASYVVFGRNTGFLPTLELSCLDGSNGFKINGENEDDNFGISVSSAGDIDGDGLDELIIGANGADPNGESSGSSYVFGFANKSDPFILAATHVDIKENTTPVTTIRAADPNGDTPTFSITGGDDGSLFSINTNTGELSFTNPPDFESPIDADTDNIYEVEVTTSDGNGGTDSQTLNVTVNDITEGSGVFELSSLNGSNGFKINGEAEFDYSGMSVSNAGDINNDGFSDLVIGANFSVPLNIKGASYVVFGSDMGFTSSVELSNLDGSNGFKINSELEGDEFGVSVSSAGDVNGDGFDDVIIGAPDLSYASEAPSGFPPTTSPSKNTRGASYVIFGSDAGFDSSLDVSSLNGSNGLKIDGGDHLGTSVSGAGDINGDGIADLIIGAVGGNSNGYRSGSSYIVFGKKADFNSLLEVSTLDGSNGFKINGEAKGDEFGTSVRDAGDINGDGFDDLIIGADEADANGIDSGASYVVFGSDAGFSSSLDLSSLDGRNGFKINGEAANDQFGTAVSGAGDINGDSFADLIIGANNADPNDSNSGASYVIFGSDANFSPTLELSSLDGSNGFKINGEFGNNNSVVSVSGAGDFNGDGLADLIIGTDANPNGFVSGASYLVFGNPAGFAASLELSRLNGTNGLKFSGEAAYDNAGRSVSGAGDINGDGFDDLIIGAPFTDANGSSSGSSYIIFGFATNKNPSITSDTSFNLDENTTVVTTVTATDIDGDIPTFSITGGADNSVFRIDSNTGELNFTNVPDFESPDDNNGDNVYEVEVTANDGKGGMDIQTLNITVNNVNEAPILTPVSKIGDEDTAIPFTATDFTQAFNDPEGSSLNQITIISLPNNGLLNVNGNAVQPGDEITVAELDNLSFTPDANFHGSTSFAWNASDGTLFAPGTTVNLTVNPVNDSPVATDDSATTPQDTPITIDVLANDSDPIEADPLHIDTFDTTSASSGTITLDDNGTANDLTDDQLIYTPATGYIGNDSFTYTISDGNGGTATATVNLTVNPANDMTLVGTPQDDTLVADSGNDMLFGLAGNDILQGEGGDDFADGGVGDDTLLGEDGQDNLFGNLGNDLLDGGLGADVLDGGEGADILLGNQGNDLLFGNLGDDFLDGGEGNDFLDGGEGKDILFADMGNDTLIGGDGDDFLRGGTGDDLLDGGEGNDRLFGDSGADQFLLRSGDGIDMVFDFSDGEDLFLLTDGLTFDQLTITSSGYSTGITVAGEQLATVFGVSATLITQADFTTV